MPRRKSIAVAVDAFEKKCLFIAPIGPKGSTVRQRSDDVLKFIVEPAAQPLGYSVIRADDILTPGFITNQILARLVTDDLVIADVTDMNANVFYELGLRHVVGKPVIHIVLRGEDLPFYLRTSPLPRPSKPRRD
jgi:hypothetical protein